MYVCSPLIILHPISTCICNPKNTESLWRKLKFILLDMNLNIHTRFNSPRVNFRITKNFPTVTHISVFPTLIINIIHLRTEGHDSVLQDTTDIWLVYLNLLTTLCYFFYFILFISQHHNNIGCCFEKLTTHAIRTLNDQLKFDQKPLLCVLYKTNIVSTTVHTPWTCPQATLCKV